MSAKVRAAIARQIAQTLKIESSAKLSQLTNVFELRRNSRQPEIHFPINKTNILLGNKQNLNWQDVLRVKFDSQFVKSVTLAGKSPSTQALVFTLKNDEFVRETFASKDPISLLHACDPKQYIVEYSSPNIAKPFHVGHLRSTIIGNFIANLYKYTGNKVHRINYLGDWGTQFGLLNVGIEIMKLSDDEIRNNPIESLYNAYVEANKRSVSDPSISERARKYFSDLENDLSIDDRNRWQKYRQYTINELEQVYQRLGVKFDEYAWESQYNQKDIQRVLERLHEKNLILDEKDGRKIVQVGDRRVPIIKSDGSTLYLARDIAAITDRFERYKFDKICYIVDNAQTDHFVSLFETSAKAIPELQDRMQHIKFGRIKGMSTRQGTVIFLKDVLDEAREVMKSRQLESLTTKVDMSLIDNEISDILGISAVIINDLKQRRQRDYEFDWDKALQANGDTGIKLQYTHCRLTSLFNNVSIQPASDANPKLLEEPEAINLIIEIARFPEVLYKSEEQLEACVLVNYLFGLSNSISRALKRLNVKHENSMELQQQRLLLFSKAQRILHDGMKILGLKPLDQM